MKQCLIKMMRIFTFAGLLSMPYSNYRTFLHRWVRRNADIDRPNISAEIVSEEKRDDTRFEIRRKLLAKTVFLEISRDCFVTRLAAVPRNDDCGATTMTHLPLAMTERGKVGKRSRLLRACLDTCPRNDERGKRDCFVTRLAAVPRNDDCGATTMTHLPLAKTGKDSSQRQREQERGYKNGMNGKDKRGAVS